MKLTEPQRRVLEKLENIPGARLKAFWVSPQQIEIRIVYYGVPNIRIHRNTFYALAERNLIKRDHRGKRTSWQISATGRKAIGR